MTKYDNCRLTRYAAGDYVIRRGDLGDDIFVLLKGEAEALKHDQAGQSYVIASLKPGQAFGEIAFIMEEPRDISVRALTDIEVEIINPRIFAELYDFDIGRHIRPIIQAFSERLRNSYSRVSEMEFQEKIRALKSPEGCLHAEVTIIPKTESSREAMNGLTEQKIEKMPFYIGRHSFRRSDMLFHANELFLFDQIPYSVSRSHCAIVSVMNEVYFVDRGSTLGSVVNGVRIGGSPNTPKKILLKTGENDVFLGEPDKSAYAFTVLIKPK
jgi:CRP-like cAMP-binding protein